MIYFSFCFVNGTGISFKNNETPINRKLFIFLLLVSFDENAHNPLAAVIFVSTYARRQRCRSLPW